MHIDLDSTGSSLVLVCCFANPSSKTSRVGVKVRSKINQAAATVGTSTVRSKKSRGSYSGSAAGFYPTNFGSRGRAKQLRQLACLYGGPLPMCWTNAVLNLSPDRIQHGITQAQCLQKRRQLKIRAFRRLLWLLLTDDSFVTTGKTATKSAATASTVSTMIQLRLPI